MYGFNSGYSQGGFNPYQPQMNRLQQLEQMQQNQYNPQMQQPAQQPQAQAQSTGIVPVGSIEEVKAFNGYFDGQPHYFIDNANNKIYIKQLGLNGMPSILIYGILEDKEEPKIEYATKEEVNNVKSILDNLLSQLGGKANDE